MTILAFILGLSAGACLGVLAASLAIASRCEEEKCREQN